MEIGRKRNMKSRQTPLSRIHDVVLQHTLLSVTFPKHTCLVSKT